MLVHILSEKLKEGVGIVGKLSAKKLSLPILENILLEAKKSFLSLSFTNLESGIVFNTLAKVEKEGKICVKRKILQEITSYLTPGKIEISSENWQLSLKSENFNPKIKGEDPSEFPIIPTPKEEETIIVSGEKFCESLKKVFSLPSASLARPEISGILIVFNREGITFAATDSFRLAEKRIETELEISKSYSLILPQMAAKEIVSIFSDKEAIKIFLSPNQIFIQSEMKETELPEIHYTCRLIEGEYPNYQEIIPKKFEVEATIDAQSFLRLVKAASIFSSKINEVKFVFLPRENKIKILSQNPDLGEMESEIPAQIKGKEMTISFNFKFLIDGIASPKGKEIQILLTKPDGPAMIKSSEERNYFYLLMPIKTT